MDCRVGGHGGRSSFAQKEVFGPPPKRRHLRIKRVTRRLYELAQHHFKIAFDAVLTGQAVVDQINELALAAPRTRGLRSST